MTSRSDIERVLDRYLAEGAEQVPDRVIDGALDQIDHIPQRRALRVPWRFHEMPSFLKPALAGAAVVAALVVGGMFLNRGPTDTAGGPPIATPSPSASVPASASPSASASLALTDTSNWVPFTSDLYGYEVAHPPAWVAQPATRDWSLEADRTDWVGFDVADRFRGSAEGGLDTLVTAFAVDVPTATSEDEWIAAYSEGLKTDAGQSCADSYEELPPVSVDGHAGILRVSDPCNLAQAFVFIDGRVHVFAVWRPDQEALLEAFLSTVEFQQ
jgi:hypothetical protein